MIEQGIYFALGCIVTALAALAFAPLFWRRALRLTRRRLQLQVPLSMQEILAERDQLRAEFAVERLRIEQAMDRIEGSKAADMAEIGRRAIAATEMAEELAKVRENERAQNDQIADLARHSAESGAERGALLVALHDAHVRLEAATRDADRLDAEAQRLHDLAEDRRIAIASLETRTMGLEMRLTDAQRASVTREQTLADTMKGRLESAMAQASRHETSGLSLRRELDETKSKLRALEPLLGERDAQIKMNDGVVAMLRSEIAALRGARDADGRDSLAGGAQSDAGLRESIHALGLAVATMMREPERKGAEPRGRRSRDIAKSPADAG